MSDPDQASGPPAKSEADQTLLGVAPPRIDSAIDLSQRAPVYVRSGTSVADSELASSPRVAHTGEVPRAAMGPVESQSAWESAPVDSGGLRERVVSIARRRPVLWMVLTPALLAGLAIIG